MKSDLEISYELLQDQLELEHSALSEDEVQLEEILRRKKNLKDDDDNESMTIGIFQSDRKVCVVLPKISVTLKVMIVN